MIKPFGDEIFSLEKTQLKEVISLLKRIILNQNNYDLKNSILRNDVTFNYHIMVLYSFIKKYNLDHRYDLWSKEKKNEYMMLSGLNVDLKYNEKEYDASIQRSNNLIKETIKNMIYNDTIMSSNFCHIIKEINQISSDHTVGLNPSLWSDDLQKYFIERIGL